MSEHKEVSSHERRLVAIMFTDIVGYTAMMEKDEHVAVDTIERHRQILENYTKKHQGEILQYYGDGSLSIFPSAIEAVECAVKIQKELSILHIPLRIGIHLGDVKIKGEAIFGDGVNVASRIQELGIAGSIIISDTIFHLIRNQSTIKTISLGSFNLKNVDEPKYVYALSDIFLSVPESRDLPNREVAKVKRSPWILISLIALVLVVAGYLSYRYLKPDPGESIRDDKSVAVLPFENLSSDPDQEYFSDGITEDIINHLAKVEALKVKSRTTTEQYKNLNKTIPVIGRELGVSYILEGSLRKNNNQIRIVAQLIDAKKDVHVWTETFDREITEIFDIQSEIAVKIARVLEARLTNEERRHIRGRGRENMRSEDITSYDYLLKAREIWRNWNDEKDLENAISLVELAIQADSANARAYVLKGDILHYGMSNYGVSTEIWINKAQELAEHAIHLDSTLADAYLLKGNIYRILDGKEEEALKNFKNAFYLKPGKPDVLESLGNYYFTLGNYDRGAKLIIKSIEREFSRRDPEYYLRWGNIYARPLNEFKKAEELYSKAISLAPGWITPYYSLSQSYRYVGELSLAENTALNGLKIAPMDQELIDVMGWIKLQKAELDGAALYWSKYKDIESQFSDTTQYIPFRHRLGYVYYNQGDTARGVALIREQLQLDTERLQNLRGYGAWINRGFYYDLAATNAFLGNHEKAIAWLDSAYERGFINKWYLENDPLLKNIQNTPEFNRIRRELIDRQQKQKDAYIMAMEEIQYIPPEIKISADKEQSL
jgi:adenylate cyclase